MSRVTVLGSANMDLVVLVDHAPGLGETVTGRAFQTLPGGKGANQALAAARAGGEVRFVGAVGDDPYGEQIRSLLADSGIDVSGLVTVTGATGTAHIVVDGAGANSIIVVPGANGSCPLAQWRESRSDRRRRRPAATTRIAVGCRGRGGPIRPSIRRGDGADSGARVPLPNELLDAVDLLVPNEHEAMALIGDDDPAAAAEALVGDGRDVLVTLGAAGALYLERGVPPLRVPAFDVAAVDTTAAGDTFVGAFAVFRAEEADRRAALRRAAAAAALSVQRPGASASMPDRAEIDTFLERQ